jgi:hypothetical protein
MGKVVGDMSGKDGDDGIGKNCRAPESVPIISVSITFSRDVRRRAEAHWRFMYGGCDSLTGPPNRSHPRHLTKSVSPQSEMYYLFNSRFSNLVQIELNLDGLCASYCSVRALGSRS